MSVKLFVTDLDGTLLPSGKDVPRENIEAVQKAVRAGVIVTIATGRMYRAALPVAEALGVDVPIITYNGALIKSTKGKVYHTSYLKPEVIEQVVGFCQEQGWYLQSYSRDELWVPVHDEHAQRYEQEQKVEGHVVGWDGLREHTQEVCKLLTISEDGQETERRLAILNERFGADIVAMQSNARYGEIVNHGVSKAEGLRRLAERLGIAVADTMAIGDSYNDLPMLKAAGHSVAMAMPCRRSRRSATMRRAAAKNSASPRPSMIWYSEVGQMSEMVKTEQAKEEGFRLVIVTGMSGGGKTQASRYLEDLGYFCVDNLPPVFIPKFVELCKHSGGHVRKVVLVVDTRSREFFDTFVHTLNDMDKDDVPYEMLFMDASDPAIIRRYKETRRRHPMAPTSRISEGIAKERERLAPVRAKATYIIDTSELRKVDLRDKIHRLFGTSGGEQMSINVLSFGFKFGMPLDADMVFDVRFLPNPFYIESMRHKSGAVPEVAEYIAKWPVTKEFTRLLDEMIDFLVPQYIKEGKSQFVIAVGCTGGMHRSVYIAKHIFDRLTAQGYSTRLEHRDLMKNDVREHVREEC